MSLKDMWRDERAIEGLPIRLVIALVVGVASLAVMMNVIGGADTLGVTELDTEPEPEIITDGETTTVNVTVTDPDGGSVANATVIAQSDSAQLDSIETAETGYNGMATLELDPELDPNQDQGIVTLDIRPPGGDYTDDRENTNILVLNT